MTGALRRFQVMAVVYGLALFVLVLAIVLQLFGHARFAKVYSPIHGYVYVGYLVAVADLARRSRWRLRRAAWVALAGTVPLLSFVVERRVVAEEQARSAHGVAAQEPAEQHQP